MPTENQTRLSTDICRLCDGNGFVVNTRPPRRCACQIEKRIWLEVPKRYWTANLEDFNQPHRNVGLAWIKNPGNGLFLYGTVGTGKTHYAAAIFRELTVRDCCAIFRRCADLYAAIRDVRRTWESEALILNPYYKTSFLILDDFGAGVITPNERAYALEIIDRRLNSRLPTILTSNWDVAAIAERMDDRIASRIQSFTVIEFNGEDRRGHREKLERKGNL